MEQSLSSFLSSPQVNAPEALALLEAEGITELRDLALIGETHKLSRRPSRTAAAHTARVCRALPPQPKWAQPSYTILATPVG